MISYTYFLLYFISNQVSYSYQSFTAHLRLKENKGVFVPSLGFQLDCYTL